MDADRQIVMYDRTTETPADLVPGEVVPVIRGNGLREGELMGYATVLKKDGADLDFHFQPKAED